MKVSKRLSELQMLTLWSSLGWSQMLTIDVWMDKRMENRIPISHMPGAGTTNSSVLRKQV